MKNILKRIKDEARSFRKEYNKFMCVFYVYGGNQYWFRDKTKDVCIIIFSLLAILSLSKLIVNVYLNDIAKEEFLQQSRKIESQFDKALIGYDFSEREDGEMLQLVKYNYNNPDSFMLYVNRFSVLPTGIWRDAAKHSTMIANKDKVLKEFNKIMDSQEYKDLVFNFKHNNFTQYSYYMYLIVFAFSMFIMLVIKLFDE